ncbi:hypothetical protein L1987_64931 [Smallanthus sonchifolius]|uniref:Uncharacterized protein n=1 Tax=Smallanthus sonchifolius TaxID=185202 RepID=A0ACB9BTA2_9ASTR|nr:hypothetical protein L1987_64931 [Smallanthus sonchifolius]
MILMTPFDFPLWFVNSISSVSLSSSSIQILSRMASSKNSADPGWSYGTLVEGTKHQVRCNFCFCVSTGGITRHKHHLAWDDSNVARCTKVPTDVKKLFKEHFEKEKKAQEAMNTIPHFDNVVELDDEDEMPSK